MKEFLLCIFSGMKKYFIICTLSKFIAFMLKHVIEIYFPNIISVEKYNDWLDNFGT